MRILLWHGWLLEGSGSNIYAARTTEAYRRAGHDVLLLCQEPGAQAIPWVDLSGTVGPNGVAGLVPTGIRPGKGRATLLRPDIGSLLPVFVLDEYEGFEVKRFVDLSDRELETYLGRNVTALAAAAAWHRPDVVITGHAIPGAAVARRALGPHRYVAKIHGSDLEYAVRLQRRYLELAREGLEGALRVTGSSRDVVARAETLMPSLAGRTTAVPPGVDVGAFRPRPRRQALDEVADRLDRDPDTPRGRPLEFDAEIEGALSARDRRAFERLPREYDQAVPDPHAAERLRALSGTAGPVVGYFGKLIPQKGVHLLVESLALARSAPRALVIGFGLYREWLEGLTKALGRGDADAARWIAQAAGFELPLSDDQVDSSRGLAARVIFTGRLDHRYAAVLAALDVLVVPSVLDEAFGMVAAEGAASGALPLVARHSGLGEVAGALEAAVGRPGMFSFEPGSDAPSRIAAGVDRLLALPADDRAELRGAVSAFARSEWTWDRTARRLLDAAGARA
jgi:glycosyltransferase involved in cell wall biosynthesis